MCLVVLQVGNVNSPIITPSLYCYQMHISQEFQSRSQEKDGGGGHLLQQVGSYEKITECNGNSQRRRLQ